LLASIRFRHPYLYKGPHLQVAAPHPSPIPPQSLETDPPSPSSAAQTDRRIFQATYWSPPPLLLRSFGFFLASFPYNFQLSALRRGNIYTTFPTNDALGAWSACNPGAPSRISHVHSFVQLFREHFTPIFLCPRFGKGKERKGDFELEIIGSYSALQPSDTYIRVHTTRQYVAVIETLLEVSPCSSSRIIQPSNSTFRISVSSMAREYSKR